VSLGLNRGPTGRVVDTLRAQLERLHRTSRRRVSLVGWNLGGLYAQQLARAAPGSVRGLVTLGTPVLRAAPWVRTASGIVDGSTRSAPAIDPAIDGPLVWGFAVMYPMRV
jgi:pimeloyl-ACP methyl ester carboxylesterase